MEPNLVYKPGEGWVYDYVRVLRVSADELEVGDLITSAFTSDGSLTNWKHYPYKVGTPEGELPLSFWRKRYVPDHWTFEVTRGT